MTVEIAKMRIVKMRNDLSYSRNGLNNQLGLINEKENNDLAIDACANWLNIR